MAIRRAFTRNRALNKTGKKHQRAREIYRVMKAAKLTLTDVQVPAAIEALNIRTTLDAMATDAEGNDVVVEFKTTQYTMERHEEYYRAPAVKHRYLKNGLLSSLYNRHQLQAAFGMLATATAHGVVIVACSNGARMYCVERRFQQRHHFKGAVGPVGKAPVKLGSWPDDDAPLATMRSAGRNARVVGRGSPTIIEGDNGKTVAIVVHNHRQYAGSATASNHKAFIGHHARLHNAAGTIVWLENRRWHSKTIVRRKSPTTYKRPGADTVHHDNVQKAARRRQRPQDALRKSRRRA